jgi:F-type H+-transporting ATPase subunit b
MPMAPPQAADNFLVPNATFVVELVAFALILWFLAKYVVPRINKALADRQTAIRREFDEAEQAKAEAKEAEEKYNQLFVEARHEAARIREEAREQGAAIVAEMREQAQAEANRIVAHAHAQLQAERQQVVSQLRTEVGSIALSLAESIVGETLGDDARRNRTIDRFIAELEAHDGASPDASAASASEAGSAEPATPSGGAGGR